MTNCEEATFLISQGMERELALSERMKVTLHTGICRGCRNFAHQVPVVSAAARSYAGKPGERKM